MWAYGKELQHYGIPGMKWGFRRRRNSSSGTSSNKRKSSDDFLRSQVLKKKKLNQLSNKELQEYNNRKNLERNYKSFKPKHIAMGIAAAGTAVTVLSHYKSIKSSIPEVISDGKSIVDKLRNIKR